MMLFCHVSVPIFYFSCRSWDRNSFRLSVRPSVTRVLCDETKEHTAEILIPHVTVITLVF